MIVTVHGVCSATGFIVKRIVLFTSNYTVYKYALLDHNQLYHPWLLHGATDTFLGIRL
jgi:hypothetical protein